MQHIILKIDINIYLSIWYIRWSISIVDLSIIFDIVLLVSREFLLMYYQFIDHFW